ncbi:dihydrofolate reductase family protein [Microbacterium sp. NPDC078428]|uniref:Dihydrofolate reductase family protein n=1 Tax=Microbacterium limosum TaxID=3079935 RepID=A0AAU0MJY2_9MICO|nr:dihydrofolate reductase family protein [Microbacterium sp. Y20]WOQ70778.1 dihydrofolate reductase family protein [Microbacterium sp. Y20]
MLVTEVLPRTLRTLDPESDEGLEAIAEIYRPAAGVRVRMNMVTGLTGSAVGEDGTSDTLTSPTDRAILKTIRSAADAVVVGAQTVRAEGYVLPRSATLAIVTASGDLSGHRLGPDASRRALIVCPRGRESEVARRTAALGAPVVGVDSAGAHLTPDEILGALAERGLRSVVCEGGTSLASAFLGAGAIDEACVSVAPALTPSSGPFVDLSERAELVVTGMLVDEAGFSYLRLGRNPGRAPSPSA